MMARMGMLMSSLPQFTDLTRAYKETKNNWIRFQDITKPLIHIQDKAMRRFTRQVNLILCTLLSESRNQVFYRLIKNTLLVPNIKTTIHLPQLVALLKPR